MEPDGHAVNTCSGHVRGADYARPDTGFGALPSEPRASQFTNPARPTPV